MHRRRFLATAGLATTSAGIARATPWPLRSLTTADLDFFRIWDSFYYTPSQERTSSQPLAEALAAERATFATAHIARFCAHLHVGAGTARNPEIEERVRRNPDEIRDALVRHSSWLLGIARVNADDAATTLAALETWIARGPMVGICLQDGKLPAANPNYDPIVRRAHELGAIIIQLNWFNALEAGNPRAMTPSTLAALAARHPDITFISGHAGGEWEQGLRAVRSHRNILVETSGFDPTAGFVEMAVRELGAERIVFGSHFPGRSIGTELGKVLSARLSAHENELIFGGNLRRLLTPILRRKNLPFE